MIEVDGWWRQGRATHGGVAMTGSDFVSRDGAGYQRQMGRWSRRLAVPFVEFAGHGDGERILDMGCGTGSLTDELTQRDASTQVIGLDYSEAYASYAAQQCGDGAQFLVADGAVLPFADDTFDRCLSLLVLHFVPDPILAISELRRVTKPGGVVAAAVWDAGGGVLVNRMFCDTAAAIDAAGEAFRRVTFGRPMTHPGELTRAWHQAQLLDVEQATLTIRMEFEDFADYWAPYIGGDGPYAAYVSTLDTRARAALAEAVRNAFLGGGSDGPRSFTASAWAVSGRVRSPEG